VQLQREKVYPGGEAFQLYCSGVEVHHLTDRIADCMQNFRLPPAQAS
jgi:hypothetical protein